MTTQADLDLANHKVVHDERVKERNRLQRLLIRPEMGALIGAVAIFIFFLVVAPPFRRPEALATVLYASSTIGIMACAVALLMIGGEFDLSAGVAVTISSLAASMLAYNLHLNLWAGAALALVLALAVGFFNGYLVMKTKIPSFLITLSTFLMLTGINLAVTKLVSGQVATPSVSDMQGWDSAKAVFASPFTMFGVQVRITVVWWLLFTAVATWVLFKTRIGNWIFAVGGDQESARAVGVPVTKVKIGLFMFVGFAAWFVGMHLLFRSTPCSPARASATSSSTSSPRSSAAACSPAATAPRSAPRSARSSSAWRTRASSTPAGTPTGSSSSWARCCCSR